MATELPPISQHAISVAIFHVLSLYPDLTHDADVLRELTALAGYRPHKGELPNPTREEGRATLLANCQKLRANLEREKAQRELWEVTQREDAVRAQRTRLEQLEAELHKKREELERIANPLGTSTTVIKK